METTIAARSYQNLVPRAYTSSQGIGVNALAFTEAGITFVCILLRLYGISIKVCRWRWDFSFVLVGTAFAFATDVIGHLGYLSGLGRHLSELTYTELFTSLKWLWVSIFVGLTGTWIGKLAIVALLYQMTTFVQTRRKIFLISIAVFNSTVTFVEVMLTVFQCEPVQYLWNKFETGSCPRSNLASTFSYVQAGITGSTDLALALYPITIVWNMNASLRTKVGFCVLMAGGVICAVAPIERSFTIKRLNETADPTWAVMPFNTWSSTELWLIVIIASIPPLRPLFLHWFKKRQDPRANVNPEVGTISAPVRKVVSRDDDTLLTATAV